MHSASLADLAQRLEKASGDAEIRRLSPGLRCALQITSGADAFTLVLDEGKVHVVRGDAPGDLRMQLPQDVLNRMFGVPPPPRHQGFTALQIANPQVRFEGDPLLVAQARAALERLFEIALDAPVHAARRRARSLSQIRGRYDRLKCADADYDIYSDVAGSPSNPPLIFLHTAGADARQYQAQLSDVALADLYHIHAPDLPFHGRSLPPLDWDGASYSLDGKRYVDWICAYLEQVVQRPAILAGCSMGAAATLLVAARRPDLLCGVIAIEPPFLSRGRINRGQNDVAVHAGLHNGAFIRGLMAPTSPEACRRRAAWIYSQAAPGIYQGDLHFYSIEFDGARTAPLVPAAELPVILMSGGYDYSATPEDGRRLAGLMPGARHIVMPELGHFPMTEHPDLFAHYLDEAIAQIDSMGMRPQHHL